MKREPPPYPLLTRAVIIVGLAAAGWAAVWIVARGVIWIARSW